MSILQEYEKIRRMIGEEEYKKINDFLDSHPSYFISDIYYNVEGKRADYCYWKFKTETDKEKKKIAKKEYKDCLLQNKKNKKHAKDYYKNKKKEERKEKKTRKKKGLY